MTAPERVKAAILDTPDARRVLDLLRTAGSVVVTTHEGPDGDGIGSELALCRALRRLGKRVKIVNPSPTVRRFTFLDRDADILPFKPALRKDVLEADLALLIDTCELQRTATIATAIGERTGPTMAIDHHRATPASIPGILGADFSSTGEIMVHVLVALGVALDADLADPLYAAILFDTDRFHFSRNDPEVFRVAADLVAAGADAERAAKALFGTVSRDAMLMTGRLLATARFEEGGRLAWAPVTPETLAGLSVDRDEVRSMVSTLADIEGVDIAVLFKVFEDRAKVKVSIRSRGGVTIGDVAEALGGGGHPCAAGADVTADLDTVTAKTLPMLREKLRSL
jgi:phosphoesterase RecJ-like protein